ncbi:toprim domain-containing protein [Longispora fulva]|uniref:toprim domain-containing protein n=1 Tax=Longispora fulva TaxID=619741 RepID=UPI0036D876C3
MEEATATFAALLDGSPAEEYLHGRAFQSETLERSQIGYVGADVPGFTQYRGMISIPYLTRAGAVSMKFRHVDDRREPKYLGLPGLEGKPRLYGVTALDRTEDFLVITEGELDRMAADQAGLPAVGLPGVDTWRGPYRQLVIKGGYRTVYFLADNDDKGQGRALAEKVAEDVRGLRVILMPEGMDVNKMIMERGEEALRARMGL